ncbi:MAG: hypothetical protein ACI9DH_000564 [Halioglobus sp.]|jgi:hypothetical protein
MAYTQTQLDELQSAYARGVLEVWLPDGSKMRFRSLDEMNQIITTIKSELGTNPTYTNIAYPKYKSGF